MASRKALYASAVGAYAMVAAGDTLAIPNAAITEGALTPTGSLGDIQWSTNTHTWMKWNGTKWMSVKRSVTLKMCSADFTPATTGSDLGGLMIVPYDPNSATRTSVAWTVTDIIFRCETTGTTASSVQIARSTGTGAFSNAGYLNTTASTIAAAAYEAAQVSFAVSAVNSGDKLMPNYTALGTGAAGFTLEVILCET